MRPLSATGPLGHGRGQLSQKVQSCGDQTRMNQTKDVQANRNRDRDQQEADDGAKRECADNDQRNRPGVATYPRIATAPQLSRRIGRSAGHLASFGLPIRSQHETSAAWDRRSVRCKQILQRRTLAATGTLRRSDCDS